MPTRRAAAIGTRGVRAARSCRTSRPAGSSPTNESARDVEESAESEDKCQCCRQGREQCGKIAVHYSVLSCIACKSFFYRATKNLRGKGYAGDQLKDPEVHARHLQDAKRYANCLDVGMRPMLVLDRLKKGNSHAQQRYIAATTPRAPLTPPRANPASPSCRRPRADSQPLTAECASPRPQKRARKAAPKSRPVFRSRRTRTRTAKATASAAYATEDNEATIVACKAAEMPATCQAPVPGSGLTSTSPSLATSFVDVSGNRASPVASVAIPVAEINAVNAAASPQRACVSQQLQWPVEADIDDEAAMEEWDMSFMTAAGDTASSVDAEPAVDLSFPLDVKVFDAPAPAAVPTVPAFDGGYASSMPAAPPNFQAAMSLMFRHFVAAGGLAGGPTTGNHMGAFHLLPFAGVPTSCGMPMAPPGMGSFMPTAHPAAAAVTTGPAGHSSDQHPF